MCRGIRCGAEENVGDERRALNAGELARSLEQRRVKCRRAPAASGTSRQALRSAWSAGDSARKPRSTRCRCMKLRMSSPAPVSSIDDERDLRGDQRAAQSLRAAAAGSAADGFAQRASRRRRATTAAPGASPKAIPVTTARPSVTAEHGEIDPDLIEPRDVLRRHAREHAQSTPRQRRHLTPPRARTAGCSRSAAGRTSRVRAAPRATRTLISRSRTAARESMRLATFAHAMSSTAPTAAIITHSDVRSVRPTTCSGSGTRCTPKSAFVGYCCSSRRPSAFKSATARGNSMPSLSRATE